MANQRWMGRYRLDEPLGRGSMGEVWRAHDEVLGRTVAIKVLPEQVSHVGSVEGERLLREAHAAARVEHPNVVALYDIDRAEGRPFIVMEALDGRTLSAELEEDGPLPIDEVWRIWEQVCAALEAVHAAGVVHRDIKPSNLVRVENGEIKLVDFGLADDGWGGRLTNTGVFMGTAAYAAPERVRGEPGDERSDLYSLGCTLYELLTGRPPFRGDLLAQTYAHVHTEPEPVSRWREDVPADLEALVMGLLSKDPERRPPLGTVPPRRRSGRRLVPVVAGAVTTAGLATVLTLAWLPSQQTPGTAESAVTPSASASERSGPPAPSSSPAALHVEVWAEHRSDRHRASTTVDPSRAAASRRTTGTTARSAPTARDARPGPTQTRTGPHENADPRAKARAGANRGNANPGKSRATRSGGRGGPP